MKAPAEIIQKAEEAMRAIINIEKMFPEWIPIHWQKQKAVHENTIETLWWVMVHEC